MLIISKNIVPFISQLVRIKNRGIAESRLPGPDRYYDHYYQLKNLEQGVFLRSTGRRVTMNQEKLLTRTNAKLQHLLKKAELCHLDGRGR